MQTVVNVHEFKTHYPRYLQAVRRGKTIIVGSRGKAVAELRPLSEPRPKRQAGQLKGKIWMSDDFDEPMTDLWNKIANK